MHAVAEAEGVCGCRAAPLLLCWGDGLLSRSNNISNCRTHLYCRWRRTSPLALRRG